MKVKAPSNASLPREVIQFPLTVNKHCEMDYELLAKRVSMRKRYASLELTVRVSNEWSLFELSERVFGK